MNDLTDIAHRPDVRVDGPSDAFDWIRDGSAPSPAQVTAFLDHAARMLDHEETVPAIWGTLFAGLRRMQIANPSADWHAPVRQHRLAARIWEDPCTDWSRRTPRGYHGDAHLIDFIYDHPAIAPEVSAATPQGQAIYTMVISSSASIAVQERRRLLVRWLDATAERVADAQVLALASGHLRELAFTRNARRLGRIVALDQDAVSIEEMRRSYADLPTLFPVVASIGRIITRPLVYGQFDLAYAAGLFDYLDDRTATRLLHGMFSALKPGGRLLFANFCHDVVDYGYMDALMDWRLLARDEPEMRALVATLPAAEIANTFIFRGLNRAIVYALVEKR